MGYTTDFYGQVEVNPPLNEHEISYLNDFSGSRRMNRTGGPYLADPGDDHGQYATWGSTKEREAPDEILDYNRPPDGQPGLWCQWVPTEDGKFIEWDMGEKFYHATEWMQYLIDHFLKPGALAQGSDADPRFEHFTFDHFVNGEIEAQGEDPGDKWLLEVTDNVVSTKTGRVVYE